MSSKSENRNRADGDECQLLWKGRHLCMASRGGWEFVTRPAITGVVGIVALTSDERLVVIQQHRPPVGSTVIELPAGLAGDEEGAEDEALVEAARRELLEETGFAAARWKQLGCGFSSPGMTDEAVTFFLAEDLEKRGPGGGVENESIDVHEVPLTDLISWVQQRREEGAEVDLKLFAGLYLAMRELESRGNE